MTEYETNKTIKERLWGSMEENPYYEKVNGKYVPKSDAEIARVRAQELAEREEGKKKYESENYSPHSVERYLYKMAKENENTENTGGRRKRRSHKRKSHKRKSNKRKSSRRRGSRRR